MRDHTDQQNLVIQKKAQTKTALNECYIIIIAFFAIFLLCHFIF